MLEKEYKSFHHKPGLKTVQEDLRQVAHNTANLRALSRRLMHPFFLLPSDGKPLRTTWPVERALEVLDRPGTPR